MKILRRQEQTGNKCPNCRETYVDFLQMSDDLLGCLSCGIVFLSKEGRGKAIRFRNSIILKKSAFACSKCSKVCKSKAGLVAHERICKGVKEPDEVAKEEAEVEESV